MKRRNLMLVVCCLAGAILLPASQTLLSGQEKPKAPDKKAQEALKLPDGVIHVALPPGELRMENILRDGKPILRVTVGKTVIEARNVFLGNAKGAFQIEATKKGMHWVPGSGGMGPIINGVDTYQPGAAINIEDYLSLDKLKAGSLYVTTPSIIFRWGRDAIPKR